jgi:hypothetical protein
MRTKREYKDERERRENMVSSVSFRGATGRAWSFKRVDAASAWARVPGIAIFAAADSYGWRIVKLVDLSGREHDVRPLWALANAERYGADTVFVAMELEAGHRAAMMVDLEAGLSPVLHAAGEGMAIAA